MSRNKKAADTSGSKSLTETTTTKLETCVNCGKPEIAQYRFGEVFNDQLYFGWWCQDCIES